MTETVLQFNDLAVSVGSTEVLKGISAAVRSGDVVGVLGLNGAGKTTLLETALGFCLPNSGSATIFGGTSAGALDVTVKARIGFVPQRDELLEGVKCQIYLDLIAGFYPAWNPALVKRLAHEWLVPLDKKISTLSVGQRQKLSIIAALGHEPDLIVLDEPVASLDPVARRQFLTELVDIASMQTRSIVFSTHIVSDLERVASRVWLLKDGQLAIDEELDDLKEHCARVQLPPGVAVPQLFLHDSAIHWRREHNANIMVFTRWTADQHRQLEEACGLNLTPQWLALEDIFLELHA